MWHHGTPNIGEPAEPRLEASAERGIRWLGFDRPAYDGSTAVDGRTMAYVAGLAARMADAAGAGSFVAVGHSGGGPHALACGALLSEPVSAVVSIAGLAPLGQPAPTSLQACTRVVSRNCGRRSTGVAARGDVAYVSDWGPTVRDVVAPALVGHGVDDGGRSP